jgi:8-oxo-dGTP diphosphatase
MSGALEVGAAVLRDAAGRVLVAQRGPRRSHAGMWEFPGGKLEPGESPAAGLRRELAEELGIEVLACRPLLVLEHRYPELAVRLHVRRIDAWHGTPQAREGQPLAWVAPDELHALPLLEADRPIVQALRLPPLLAISAEPGPDRGAFLDALERTLADGVRLVQLRAPGLAVPEYAALAAEAVARCQRVGARVLLNADPELCTQLGADGVHLNGARLRGISARPLGERALVTASVHDRAALRAARALGVDAVLLGPVRATRSHPGATPLGWTQFAALAADAGLPVYALGGLGAGDLARAQAAGGHGVAAIRGLWRG